MYVGRLPVDVYPHERQYGYQVYKAVERKDVVQARYPWILMFRILYGGGGNPLIMKKHRRTNKLDLLAALPLILACQAINAQEQRLDKAPADTVVNVGYATGSIRKLSGSVELIGRTSINYSGSFGISSVYKRIGMLDADAYRNVTSGLGLDIIDKGCNTDFQKAIERTAIRQNHNIALYGGGEKSSYRVSLGYLDMEGDIMNEGKNASGAWDNLTTANQITNPLAWMEVDNREAESYFSAHAKVNINLPYRLKLVVFGSYTYIECPYGRVVKVRRES